MPGGSPKQTTLLFLRQADQILLAMKKRGFGVNKWNGVGGKVEPGETIEEAVRRECFEEISVTPTTLQKVANIDFKEFSEADPLHIQVHVFFCDQWQGEPVESEEMAPQWFPVDAIPYQKMWDDDRFWLPQALAGKKLNAQFSLNQAGEVTDHQLEAVAELD